MVWLSYMVGIDTIVRVGRQEGSFTQKPDDASDNFLPQWVRVPLPQISHFNSGADPDPSQVVEGLIAKH